MSKKILKFFSPPNRTVKLTYKEDVEFQGIAGRRYVTTKELFSSVENVKENYCYCPQSVAGLTTRGGCLKDGLLELSSCQGGCPLETAEPLQPWFGFNSRSWNFPHCCGFRSCSSRNSFLGFNCLVEAARNIGFNLGIAMRVVYDPSVEPIAWKFFVLPVNSFGADEIVFNVVVL